jgi:6-phosphofructokinase 1
VEALDAITSTAFSHQRTFIIEVMGRNCGHLALMASLASGASGCFIPEAPPQENWADKLKENIFEGAAAGRRVNLIIVAEGAGQNLFENREREKDASGNVLHADIGILLKDEITRYFKERKIELNLKYFNPGYTIRSVNAEGEDAVFCALLAQSAVHAAMAGKTDVMVGHWSGSFTHVPIALATRERKKIDLNTPLWAGVKSLTCF